MISCLLIQVARNDTGLPLASSEVRIAGDAIELGRGAACQIYLPDHRVSLLHATIRRAEDGSLHLEAAPEALISVNGFVERAAELRPGTQVGIGPYLLGVRPSAEAFDLILSLETAEAPAESPEAPGRTPVTLSALGLSTRRLGLGLAAFILLAFFVLPMLPLASPPIDKWQAGLPVRLTESVNPGPLSAGHAVSGMKCSACHQRAFRGVTDAACTKCHERVSAHLSAHSQHADRLGETRCTHCHASHEGKADAIRDGSSRCVGCHKRVEGTVAEARDFGSSHPPFHLTVPAGRKVLRVREDEKKMPPEKAGLKFSHQVHLDKEGVSSPDGRTVLNCRDCHKLEESGMHFAPMEMEMTCQQSRCHRLRFADPMAFMTPMIAKFIKFWPSPKAYNDESLAAKENRNYPKFATSAFASLWDYSQRMTNMLSFVKAPIVILQSRKDQVVNPQAAKIIHDKVSSKDKTLVWFERSGHEMLLDLEADLATETVMTFIKRIAG